jgi:hypothetical protein
MAVYITSYSVERKSIYPSEGSGFRYAADFNIKLAGSAYATIVLTLLWNAEKTLIPGTNRTETRITGAGLAMSKSGIGWAVIADVMGEEPWIQYNQSTVIQFRKRFTVELPTAPALSGIPKLGEIAKELGATTTTRIQVEGYFDVVSYISKLETKIY